MFKKHKSVAIIGAGLAGLYCALELERHNIYPVLFERSSFIGEPFSHTTAVLNLVHRPIRDFVRHVKEEYAIDILPINTVDTVIHYSPKKVATIKGDLGYLFKYSKDEDSIKHQLYYKLKKSKVIFNEIGDYEKLMQEYDYVVAANGTHQTALELGCWQDWLKTYARGAVVLGDFDPRTIIMWLDKDYCKNGYAYLTPFDGKKASIVLIATNVNEKEIDHYWELFLYREKIRYTIIEEFKLEHRSGHVYPRQVDNLYMIGNAGGGVEPFLGFGHVNGLTMGIAAARSIIQGISYEGQLTQIIDRNIQMRDFRKMFNKMSNASYDIMVPLVGFPGIKHLLYHTNINVSKYGSIASRLLLQDPFGKRIK